MNPNNPPGGWRAMRESDLPAVHAIAQIVHPDYPERPEVARERLALYPYGCFVLEGAEGLAGYLVSHPWHDGVPPALDALLGSLPENARTYYLHDLALLPEGRGKGHAQSIVERVLSTAQSRGFEQFALTAVNGTGRFWGRFGFEDKSAVLPPGKLASYGGDALYMRKNLHSD